MRNEQSTHTDITKNLKLANHLARKVNVPGYGKDDLRAEAYLALVKAVNNMPEDHPNPKGYLVKSIWGHLRNLKRKSFATVELDKEVVNHERVDLCPLTNEEKYVVEARMQGLDDGEIGTILGRSRSYIYELRRTIYARMVEFIQRGR